MELCSVEVLEVIAKLRRSWADKHSSKRLTKTRKKSFHNKLRYIKCVTCCEVKAKEYDAHHIVRSIVNHLLNISALLGVLKQ